MFGKRNLSNTKSFFFPIFLLTILFHEALATVTVLPTCGNVNGKIEVIGSTCKDNASEPNTISSNKYCINSDKTAYKSENSNDVNYCKKDTDLVANTYYVFECSNAYTCALKTAGEIDSLNNEKLLLYQYVDSKLKQIKNDEFVLVHGSSNDKLISCPNGANNGECVVAADGIYLNPGNLSTISTPLIKVDTRIASGLTTVAGATYIYSNTDNKLIKCTSTTSCELIDPEVGKYINSGVASANEITCSSSGETITCVSAGAAANANYLNLAVTGSLTNALLKCTSGSTCTLENGVDGKYYMHGTDNNGILIKCTTAGGCVKVESPSTTGVYLDEGTSNANVIICPTEITCKKVVSANTGNTYLDASNGKNLITDGATFSSELTSSVTGTVYYVDTLNKATNVLECTSSGCQSVPGSKLQGHAYVDGKDNKKLIIYNTEYVSSNTNTGSVTTGYAYFIDGSNPKKIITCTGAAGGATCASPAAPDLTGKTYVFYPDGTESAHTIACSSSGCVSSKGLIVCKSGAVTSSALCQNTTPGDIATGSYCIHENGKIYKSFSSTRKRSDSCTDQALNETYIFVQSSSTIGTLGSTGDIIYTCDSQKCTQIISSGYHNDPTSYLYSCDNDGMCTKESPADGQTYLSGVATINATPPYLTSGLTKCTKSGAEFAVSDCKTVTSPSGIYKNSAVAKALNNPSALIKCVSGKCRAIDGINNSFYLSNEQLITCDNGGSSGCVLVANPTTSPNYCSGYLFDFDTKVGDTDNYSKLIKCDATSKKCASVEPAEGYYIYGIPTAQNNIVKCIKNRNNVVVCSLVEHSGTDSVPLHYYNPVDKAVIKCKETGDCINENITGVKGYFLNDGNPDKPIIKCTGAASNPCSEETVESTCSKAGKVKKTDDGIFLCVSANNADEHMKIVSKTEGTPEDPAPPPKVYRSVVAANEFPGNNASTDFTVRNDNDGKVILMEDGISLPACGSTCESSKHCVDGNVIKTGDGACAAITGSASSTSVLYFKEDTTIVEAALVNSNTYVYQCSYDSDGNATKCEIIKGYVATNIGSGSINSVYCSGWKYDICTFSANDALGADTTCEKLKLIYNAQVKICTATPESLGDKKILFYPTEVNEYYGIRLTSNTGFVGLELTETSAKVTLNLNFNKYGYQINPAALGTLEKALIKCTTPSTISSCTVVDAKEGYYHMGNTSSDPVKGTGNLIKCTKDSGCVLTASDNGNLNYFIDASDTSKIIKCTGTGTDNECSSINHGGTARNPTHYASTTGELYTCNNEGCIQENPAIKGYFLNSSGNEGKTLIKCEGSTDCKEEDDVATYSGLGSVKVTSDGHIFMCVDVGCSGAGEIEIKPLTTTIYKTVRSGSEFPKGVTNVNDITVKFDKDGSVFLLDSIELPSSGTTADGEFQFTSQNQFQIYKSESWKNVPETEAGIHIYFFDMNNKRVDAPTSGTLPNVSAYQCVYEETDNKLEDGTFEVIQKSCVQVKGFAKIPGTSNIVQCSGWIREGCTITTLKSCAAEDEGKLGTGNKICFGTETLPLPTATATEPSYIAYKIHDFNTYYGKGKSDTIIYLQLTATSAIAVNPSANMGYIIKEGNEYKLYKYTSATKSYALGTSDDDGVKLYEVLYDSYTYYASSFLNTENTVLFYCYRGTCTKSNGYIVVKTKVYENSSSSKGEWNEVPDASQVCTSGTASHVSNIKYGSSKVQLCIPKSEGTSPDLVDVEDDIYFLPSGNNLKMYISGDSNKIIATPDPIDGYYYIKDNKIETTADQTNGKLVKCMNKTCIIQSMITDGFYYIVFNDILIKYTTTAGSQTHSFIENANVGYYIDYENALVHCTTGQSVPSCEYSHDIGFFKNTGDTTTNIYIQCTAKGCKAIPDPTAECNSDSQVGQLTKGGKLCLKNGITKEFASASQLVYYQSGSVFKYYVNKSTYFGLIKMTSESMVLDFSNTNSDWCVDSSTLAATATSTCSSTLYHCNVDGVCVDSTSNEILPESIRDQKIIAEEEKEESTSAVDIKIECDVRTGNNCDNDYYLVNKEENYSLAESQGALFYCDPEKQKPICSEIFDVGYYIKDKEAIFSCKAGNNGLDCTLDKLTEENIACNANSVGKPFLNQNKLALCLDYDEGATTAYAIDLTPTTSGNYIIKKDSSNLFDIPSNRDYAIVSVKEKIITINLNYTNKLKYVYANKDAKMKLLEKGDTCPKNGSALDETKILELNCVNSKCTTDLTIS